MSTVPLDTLDHLAALQRPQNSDELRVHLKALYDHIHALAPSKSGPIADLVVQGIEADQIWAELCFMNKPLRAFLEKSVRRATRATVRFPELDDDMEEDGEELDDDDGDDDSDEYDDDEDEEMEDEDKDEDNEEDEEEMDDKTGNEGAPDFFDMDEMERFVKQAEEEGEDDEVADLLDQGGDDDEAGEIRYGDFFDQEGNEEDEMDEFEEEMADLGGDASLRSAIEKRDADLKRKVEEIESKLLEDKHWGLRGEVSQKERPEGSLLESYVDFDQVIQTAPRLGADHSRLVEECIKKRVLEGLFDNVARRVDHAPRFKASRVELQHTRSEKGLGELFEQAYLQATNQDEAQIEAQTEPQKRASRLFADLCRSLDALTNSHFTPSAPKVAPLEAKVGPAIRLEEVAPVSHSASSAVPPEKLGERMKQVGDNEKSREERRRDRKQKKQALKKRREQKESEKRARAAVDPEFAAKMRQEKEVAAIGTHKGTTVAEGKSGGTKAGKEFKSAAFFAQLQEGESGRPKKREKKSTGSGANYKL